MKIAAALALAMMFSPQTYPFRVRIIEVQVQSSNGIAAEHGYGNFGFGLGLGTHYNGGFDFVSECDPFEASHGPTFYAARMKDNHNLILAMAHIGSDKVVECKLKVTMQPFLYDIDPNGHLITRAVESQ